MKWAKTNSGNPVPSFDVPVTSTIIRKAPKNPYVTGYGKKIPTKYMVRTKDQRWRRVYCVCYSNIGTLYVLEKGIAYPVNVYV